MPFLIFMALEKGSSLITGITSLSAASPIRTMLKAVKRVPVDPVHWEAMQEAPIRSRSFRATLGRLGATWWDGVHRRLQAAHRSWCLRLASW